MHETPEDIARLERLLDESARAAGPHLRNLFGEDLRVPAQELPAMLPGVQVLVLATVTAKGEPRAAPVDGLFYRGRWHFGSSERSARFRHLRARPAVSATHVRGEELAVIVHGRAREIDARAEDGGGFHRHLLETYGADWADWGGESPYAVIEPDRMFTRLWRG
jgi:nitroimidazol reductase NimA-like FMN-containing flavoprotein (pyridoxamine 5'-phosphate oxidase superfamily)